MAENEQSGGGRKILAWRKRTYEILEIGRGEDRTSKLVDRFLIILILANVTAFAVETVPAIGRRYGGWFFAFEIFSVLIFTIEYVLRLWSSVEMPVLQRKKPMEARLKFAMRPYLIIDLLAIAPFYLGALFSIDLRILRMFRLFRFLKVARYSPALHSLSRVLIREATALGGVLILMTGMLLVSASGIYFLENEAQPDKFSSIPTAAWWAMATLTTVGYGDVYPITPLGQLFGAFVMILGLGMYALPIAIIANGFSVEAAKREFVVTWSMVARFPLFAKLDPSELADIMEVVESHIFAPNREVIKEGDQAEAIFFIVSGEVEIGKDGDNVFLGEGDFFGEIGVLENKPYVHTATTLRKTRLLELTRTDFLRLSNRYEHIGELIRQVSQQRKADGWDLVAEE